jgi:CRISPR-associated protein Cmr1
MARMMPKTVVPVLKPPNLEAFTLDLRTITPMFGGSAGTRVIDKDNPVRSASVRRHLRFWWRATAGASYPSSEALFQAEERVWGSAKVPGLVALRVEIVQSGDKKPCAVYPSGKSWPDFGKLPAYALFPFQGKANRDGIQEAPSEMLLGIQFNLHLCAPAPYQAEINQAISAWVAFGGIGARTRRGCGSLEAKQLQSLPSIQAISGGLLTRFPRSYSLGNTYKEPIQAWKEAVDLYRDFRQKEEFARNKGEEHNRPGRSRYPEADEIRRRAGANCSEHPPRHPVRGFPRADLGLPIVFHFKDEKQGDPEDHTLQGAKSEQTRFASPIITKAIAVAGGYAAVIIVLDAPHVWENGPLVLKAKRNRDHLVTTAQVQLNEAELAKITPLKGLPIREALLQYAKSRGFREVHL